jgi:hypothetical protein
MNEIDLKRGLSCPVLDSLTRQVAIPVIGLLPGIPSTCETHHDTMSRRPTDSLLGLGLTTKIHLDPSSENKFAVCFIPIDPKLSRWMVDSVPLRHDRIRSTYDVLVYRIALAAVSFVASSPKQNSTHNKLKITRCISIHPSHRRERGAMASASVFGSGRCPLTNTPKVVGSSPAALVFAILSYTYLCVELFDRLLDGRLNVREVTCLSTRSWECKADPGSSSPIVSDSDFRFLRAGVI